GIGNDTGKVNSFPEKCELKTFQSVKNSDKRATSRCNLPPRRKRKKNNESSDVEYQDSINNLDSCIRDIFFRVFRFSSRNSNQFKTTKREHDKRHRRK